MGSAKIMLEEYLIVHKSILPDYYEKVINARQMVEEGKARDISEAAKLAGISRSTYYKYKDYVFEPSELSANRKAVISCMLSHETGMLSSLISCISSFGCSILTIDQSLPIHDVATVTCCLDISSMAEMPNDLINAIAKIPGIKSPKLVSIE